LADTYDLTRIERIERVVPASPEAVEAVLAEQTSLVPGRGTFTGSVGRGRFSLLRKRMGKRNLRPRIEGTLEAVPGGTRLVATCALPSWGQFLGRGVFLWSILFGMLWLGAFFGLSGVPESTWMAVGAAFLALVWLPITGVVISGSIVKQAVEERAATPVALTELLDATWPQGVEEGADAGEDEARREAARRTKQLVQPS